MNDVTIDEAIEELKKENGYYANNGMTDVAEFNTKIIRWLEDYKMIKMLIPIEQALKVEYNKAIDDFAEKIKSNDRLGYVGCLDKIIDELAEQLKAGVDNE